MFVCLFVFGGGGDFREKKKKEKKGVRMNEMFFSVWACERVIIDICAFVWELAHEGKGSEKRGKKDDGD